MDQASKHLDQKLTKANANNPKALALKREDQPRASTKA
jgi:hypothetical protein